MAMALRNLGIIDRCSLQFVCETDRWCKSFVLQNHPKHVCDDIDLRDPSAVSPCDLYVAGFLCQPFSRTWLRNGTRDSLGRGTLFEHMLEYLHIHRPRVVILENVAGLMDRTFADTYAAMLDSLRGIKGKTGRPYYTISTQLVDSSASGIPHNKKKGSILFAWHLLL